MRYLVVEKGIQLSGEKDITMDTLCRNLDLVLRFLPEDATSNHHGIQAQLPDLHRDAVYEDHRQCEEKSESHNLRSLETTSDGSVNDVSFVRIGVVLKNADRLSHLYRITLFLGMYHMF